MEEAQRLHLMDLDALAGCVTSASCVVTQTTSGLIIGMLLFLVAAGLTLIFGVLKIVNFTHGPFYMLGAYSRLHRVRGHRQLRAGRAGRRRGDRRSFGVVFERFFISRVYGAQRADAAAGLLRRRADLRRPGEDRLGAGVPRPWACRRRSRCRRCSSPAAWCRRSTSLLIGAASLIALALGLA